MADQIPLQMFKVTSLPAALEVHSWYLVINGNYVETYVTDAEAKARLVGNTIMIKELIGDALTDFNTLIIRDTIAQRDALNLEANSFVLVTDASADATVNSGSALYVYNETTGSFVKIQEYEALDMSITWSNIQGKPNSTVAAIDDAVNKRHSHPNASVLNALGYNEGLTYEGQPVVVWKTVNW